MEDWCFWAIGIPLILCFGLGMKRYREWRREQIQIVDIDIILFGTFSEEDKQSILKAVRTLFVECDGDMGRVVEIINRKGREDQG